MKLFSFLQTLLTEGQVTVDGQLSAFDEEDLTDSAQLLQQFYVEDILQMPATAPAFSAGAAIWAAKHIYLSLQLIVLREITEEAITETLKPFNDEVSPSVIYSADLVLRYLPGIFHLARGLAPADIMVKKLTETATQWPFSSVGMKLDRLADDSIIMSHPSLRIEYTDRVIKSKDLKRICSSNINESIKEALGSYTAVLWPEFHELISTNKICINTT